MSTCAHHPAFCALTLVWHHFCLGRRCLLPPSLTLIMHPQMAHIFFSSTPFLLLPHPELLNGWHETPVSSMTFSHFPIIFSTFHSLHHGSWSLHWVTDEGFQCDTEDFSPHGFKSLTTPSSFYAPWEMTAHGFAPLMSFKPTVLNLWIGLFLMPTLLGDCVLDGMGGDHLFSMPHCQKSRQACTVPAGESIRHPR